MHADKKVDRHGKLTIANDILRITPGHKASLSL